MDIRSEIRQVLIQTRDEIRANMVSKNINASGRTSAAFGIREDATSIALVLGEGQHAPLETLEIGRPAGNVPGGLRLTKAGVMDVSNAFKWILIKWAEDKGFELNWGGATMLGRRIAQQGTLRHMTHEDVYSTPVNVAIPKIRAAINKSISDYITQSVKTNF